jgi:ceramide glucosyltransferase
MFRLATTEYEIIFAANTESDAAIAVAQTICERYPFTPSKIIVNTEHYCINPKLNNIYKAWLVAKGDSILMADCNVYLPKDTFERLEARWDDTTGLVCSPPIGSQPNDFAAEIECAFLNTFEAKWQILADWLGQGFCQGKVMFCRKAQFESIGGLIALDAEACEDAAATKLVRSAGLHVRLVRKLFEQPLGERSYKQIWNRQLRWAKLRRVTMPLWYVLEILVTPIPLLIGLIVVPSWYTLLYVVIGYIFELALAKYAKWYLSWRMPFAFLVRDVMILGIWINGWFGSKFHWSGRELELNVKGAPSNHTIIDDCLILSDDQSRSISPGEIVRVLGDPRDHTEVKSANRLGLV